MKITVADRSDPEQLVKDLKPGEVYRCVQNGNIYLKLDPHMANLRTGAILYEADCSACKPTLTFLHQPDAYLVV